MRFHVKALAGMDPLVAERFGVPAGAPRACGDTPPARAAGNAGARHRDGHDTQVAGGVE